MNKLVGAADYFPIGSCPSSWIDRCYASRFFVKPLMPRVHAQIPLLSEIAKLKQISLPTSPF